MGNVYKEAADQRWQMPDLCSFPFKGKVGMGMGLTCNVEAILKPIPTPALPLKGREQSRKLLAYD
jgi:hypothetical protein